MCSRGNVSTIEQFLSLPPFPHDAYLFKGFSASHWGTRKKRSKKGHLRVKIKPQSRKEGETVGSGVVEGAFLPPPVPLIPLVLPDRAYIEQVLGNAIRTSLL